MKQKVAFFNEIATFLLFFLSKGVSYFISLRLISNFKL